MTPEEFSDKRYDLFLESRYKISIIHCLQFIKCHPSRLRVVWLNIGLPRNVLTQDSQARYNWFVRFSYVALRGFWWLISKGFHSGGKPEVRILSLRYSSS